MKRKRKWWFIAVFVALVAGTFLVFLALGEHPDYRRAAKGLDEARSRAQELIGPMSWAEYRAERGVGPSDDLEDWEELEDSIPQAYHDHSHSLATRTNVRPISAVYQDSRAWLFSLAGKIEGLRLTHLEGLDEDHRFSSALQASGGIATAVWALFLGAADAGDVDGMLEATKVGTAIFEKQAEEYDMTSAVFYRSGQHMMGESIVHAAVRNRHDTEVMTALREALGARLERPPNSARGIGEARTLFPLIDQLKSLRPEEIEEWLDANAWSSPVYYYGKEMEFLRGLFAKFGGEERRPKRGVGASTAAALEARFWEALIESVRLADQLEYGDSSVLAKAVELEARIDSPEDRSYELASHTVPIGDALDNSFNSELTMRKASKIALELISRYPDLDHLPSALPEGLAESDPFGGEPLIYRRTQRGFLIYSRGGNRVDDGFVPYFPGQMGSEVLFTGSEDGEDRGLIVSYDPLDPLP